MTKLDTVDSMPPATLTDREAEAVAGGALLLPRPGGCPTCTSGGYLDFRDALGAVINPAINVAAVKTSFV